ncbi:6069_t:CDS:2 [Racocetra fulgida]|uniref:6069_t:CDS:1 n=1 Tax=Racocetra fulgida TaxID=60492 RepID=A0A9N9F326_9GLOM|nr:6069_t:CDS:2 [Racocetra fulgida]
MSEPVKFLKLTNLTKPINELQFAKRCARCIRQKKGCDHRKTLGPFKCTKNGKLYFLPGDENKYEIGKELFEDLLKIQLKNGFNLAKFMIESGLSTAYVPYQLPMSESNLSQLPTSEPNLSQLLFQNSNTPELDFYLQNHY